MGTWAGLGWPDLVCPVGKQWTSLWAMDDIVDLQAKEQHSP